MCTWYDYKNTFNRKILYLTKQALLFKKMVALKTIYNLSIQIFSFRFVKKNHVVILNTCLEL